MFIFLGLNTSTVEKANFRLVQHQLVLPISNSNVQRSWYIAFSLKRFVVMPLTLEDILTGAAFARAP